MIGYLKGRCVYLDQESVILEVQGVGYEVYCSLGTLSELSASMQEEVVFWIYTHVREDQLQLFGFLTKEEKNLFLSLLKVNGVGPKSALSILSGARYNQLVEMIESGDAKALSQLPKIGKKTAEQIILSLQGKLVRIEEVKKTKSRSSNHQQIATALINLGFKPQLIEEFLQGLAETVTVEEGVRKALGQLSQL
ncbi:MAG: Holliday junction branch migration protein RuvA [Bdellovibrionaceae bacterium]|nr:Holliday junction branch migration protein RuvA [Pseudobdellovibrionaceae bacterium]